MPLVVSRFLKNIFHLFALVEDKAAAKLPQTKQNKTHNHSRKKFSLANKV